MGKYHIIEDPEYHYLRIEPLPTDEEVKQYYSEEFYSLTYPSFNDSSLEVQIEERDFFESHWESIYSHCTAHFPPGSSSLSVFDIGFGYGLALRYFKKKGWVASGLEPNSEGVEYARSAGLDVFQAGIEEFTCVGDRRFDIVTLLNVLEHLRNPAETLTNIRTQLLKTRSLLVIEVPNEFNDFQTVANVEYDLNEWWVCPPNHINYFTAGSVQNLLERCGYKVEYVKSSFPLELFLLFGDVYVNNPDLGKICHTKRVHFEYLMKKHGKKEKLEMFYKSLATLELGRQVTIYASPAIKENE
jgi:SAM-dependent methyltransferase